MKTEKPWSICEVQYVIDHYNTTKYKQIGAQLKRTTYSIKGLVKMAGLKKQTEPKKHKMKRKLVFTLGVKDWLLGEVISGD